MKTTLEIPDALFRQVKAWSALQDQTMREFILDAISQKLKCEARKEGKRNGWRAVFGQAPAESLDGVREAIEDEFSRIDPEHWK